MFEYFKTYKMICDNCHRLSRDLANVREMPITNEMAVEKGDVIRYYTYIDDWHDAVILEVTLRSHSQVSCTIMHYAFLKLALKKTIKKDEITIELNGKYCKLDYNSKYNVYTPDEVVRRAYTREGEQLYERVLNDSWCFARWCKI